jgi:general secretion pathway protein A
MHHLKVAGCDKQIFTDDAIKLIYQCSKGVPRRVNNICRYALIAAAMAGSTTVDADAVQKGMDDDELI